MANHPEPKLSVAGEWRQPVINPGDEAVLGTAPHLP
jgi:hypothetical protein